MTQEIVIPYVCGKIADGCKRFDLDIVMRMVVEYNRVQNHLGEMKAENNRMWSEIVSANAVANSATTELDQCRQAFAALKMKLSRVVAERDELLLERDEAVEVHARIMAEKCPSDEYHCTCVPALREELNTLKAEIDELTRYNAAILDQNNTLSTEKEHLMALMVEKEKVFAMENERLRAALTEWAALDSARARYCPRFGA